MEEEEAQALLNICLTMNPRAQTKLIAGMQLGIAIISCALVSCSKQTADTPSAEDRRLAQQALAPAEVLLMMRGGYKEKDVIAEVTRRRVSEIVDSVTENKLVDVGASGELISALKAKKNVLTALQKIAYDEQQTEHR